jgi:hypothetical protein
MPSRRQISISEAMPLKKSHHAFLHQTLRRLVAFGAITGFIALGATVSFAQNTPPPQNQPAPGPSNTQTPPSAPATVPGGGLFNLMQSKSLFFPDIATSTKRLSTGEKFELFVDNSISVHTITWAMLGSAVGQAENSPTGYEQGWDAYAKRFGSSMGRQASSEFFGTFILASALHEDPRFYPNLNPTFFGAAKHSIQRIFVTRNDDGRDVANISGLAGPLMAEGLANVYWPDRNRTVGDTFFRFGLDLATRAGGNMLREYWPVFYGKIHHSSQPSARH